MKRCLGSTQCVRADGRAAPGTVWVEGDWYEDRDGSGAWSTPLIVADAYEDADADKDASNLTASEIAVAKILEPVRRRQRWQLRRGNGWWERRPWQRWERWAAHRARRDAPSSTQNQLLGGGVRGRLRQLTQFEQKSTVPLLAPSASPRDRSNEARRARVAAVRRGRRRLGGWWLPSCAAAFRVEERFRVPPASVQRGGGAASSPLWHPERPESATTEER